MQTEIILKKHNISILLVRIALGIIFIIHGVLKLKYLDQTINFFIELGLAGYWAYIVGFAELISGILLVLGLWVEYAAFLIMIIMIFAIYLVKYPKGFIGGYEFEFLIFMVALSLFISGSGKYKFFSFKDSDSKYKDVVLPGETKLE